MDENIELVPKTLMSARDEIPCTVSRTNRRKQLQMLEQELNIQFGLYIDLRRGRAVKIGNAPV